MSTTRELMRALSTLTRSGALKWEVHSGFWQVKKGDCLFTLFQEGTLQVHQLRNGIVYTTDIAQRDDARELRFQVWNQYPPVAITRDQALQDSLACLTLSD